MQQQYQIFGQKILEIDGVIIDIVNYCRAQFEFDLPSTVVEKRIKKFVAKYRSCENVICKFV